MKPKPADPFTRLAANLRRNMVQAEANAIREVPIKHMPGWRPYWIGVKDGVKQSLRELETVRRTRK